MDSANHFEVSATANGDRVVIYRQISRLGITKDEAKNLAWHLLARTDADLKEVEQMVAEIKKS